MTARAVEALRVLLADVEAAVAWQLGDLRSPAPRLGGVASCDLEGYRRLATDALQPEGAQGDERAVREAAVWAEVLAESKLNTPTVAGSEGRNWWVTTAGSAVAVLLETDARAKGGGT